jgi:uncharacterized protein YbjQ (UPF0145 family)
MDHRFVSSANYIPGYHIAQSLGIVRGITVRSRSVIGNIGAGVQRFFGGNITILTQLCETAREEAYDIMVAHAEQAGANGIISVDYDATEVMNGVTEVLCYGTAVIVEAGSDPVGGYRR